jgi:Skp family chaperone for outer membrane proteins
MAKRRHDNRDEVMLIPFLDILCSLIGVLILIIVVLCVAQMQKIGGRTKEDLALAQRFQELQNRVRAAQKSEAETKAKLAALEKAKADLAAKQARLAELREQLATSAEAAKAREERAAKARLELERLREQIAAVERAAAPLAAEIEKLKAEIAARSIKPDAKPPPLVVRPSGSGQLGMRPTFFVEAGGSGVVIHKGPGATVKVATDAVATDPEFNAFLGRVKATPNATLIFLIRPSGFWSFRRAAGWAEQQYQINTGKLPLPGDGEVDLSAFRKS